MLYVFLTAAWAALPLCLLALLFLSSDLRKIVRDGLPILTFLVLGAALLLSPLFAGNFFGLEYEDAYEYINAGHLLASDPLTRDSILNPVCLIGSNVHCTEYAFLSHPIGYASLLSWLERIAGPSRYYGTIVSITSMCLVMVLLYVAHAHLARSSLLATVAPLLLLSTPVCLALGPTSFADPISALFTTLAFGLAYYSEPWTADTRTIQSRLARSLHATALLLTLLLATLVKREALSLLIVLPASIGVVVLSSRSSITGPCFRRFSKVLLLSVVAAVILYFLTGNSLFSFEIVRPTSHSAAFSLSYLGQWTPFYLYHIFSYRFFLLVPLALLGSLIVRSRWKWVALLMVVGDVLIFLTFAHSYYAVTLKEVPYYHFERYTLQVSPLLALLGGVGLTEGARRLQSLVGYMDARLSSILASALILSVGASLALPYKESLVQEEKSIRISPVVSVCNVLQTDAHVLTYEPLLFSLFCIHGPTTILAPAVGRQIPTGTLDTFRRAHTLFYWTNEDLESFRRERYPELSAYLEPGPGILGKPVFFGRGEFALYGIN